MATRRVRGDKALARQLERLATDVPKQAETAVVAGALVIQNGGKRRAPYRTGTLRRSIHIGGHEDMAPDFRPNERPSGAQPVPEPEKTRKGITVHVGTDLEYAAMQEYGGTITPKRARFLAFKIDGEFVMTRRVRIPAQPYMRPTAEEDGPEARREIGEAFRDLIRKAAK